MPEVGDYRGFRIKRYPGLGWRYDLVPEEGEPAVWDGHSWIYVPEVKKNKPDQHGKARMLYSDLKDKK